MATLASTNVSSAIAFGSQQPLAWGAGGLYVEVFTVAGGAVADTCAITPKFIADIRTVDPGPWTNNLSTTAANTNVTLTMTASAATNTTYHVKIYGKRATS